MRTLTDRPTLGVFVPRRPCAVCARPCDVLHMRLVRRTWVCAPCLAAPAAGAAAPAGAETGGLPSTAVALRQVDAFVRWVGLGLRALFYAGLLVLAHRSAVFTQLLTGVLLADAVTWALAAWFDARVNKLVHALQLGLYVVVAHVWHDAGGSFALPDEMEARAVMMLGFLGVFSIKGSLFAWKLMHGSPGEG